MRANVTTIWMREVLACFFSPIAYVTMVFFLSVTGLTFMTGALKNIGTPEPLSTFLYGAVCLWLPVLVTVVSMRLFAEEKRSGTIETLLTAPVTETEVVLGKFLGALTFMAVVILPTLIYVTIVERMSPALEPESIDRGAMAAGGVIVLAITALSLAFGVLMALMSHNQIVAAITTFCGVWGMLIGGWMLKSIPGFPPGLADFLSVTRHIEDFCRGSIEARVLVLYVSGTLLFLFWAVRALESRRWR